MNDFFVSKNNIGGKSNSEKKKKTQQPKKLPPKCNQIEKKQTHIQKSCGREWIKQSQGILNDSKTEMHFTVLCFQVWSTYCLSVFHKQLVSKAYAY